MLCPKCSITNDSDALFCSDCGTPIEKVPAISAAKSRKVYLYALLLVPVIIIAAGIGYYKFFLPGGVAAIVNGEEITVSELDAAVIRTTGAPETTDNKLRYQALNELITERLALQEAYKAGMAISREEVVSAAAQARRSSGLDDAAFKQEVKSRYGSMQNFEDALMRSLLINKLIAAKVVPLNADSRTAGAVINRWMQDLSGRASVRITLAEQLSGAGCSCCAPKSAEASPASQAENGGSRASTKLASNVASPSAASSSPVMSPVENASQVALKYWNEKHGAEKVTAKVKDYGCHMQIEIIKDNKVIGTLGYQGGKISEY